MDLLTPSASIVKEALSWAPNREELSREAEELDLYTSRARSDTNRVSKTMRTSWHLGNRKRGRPNE